MDILNLIGRSSELFKEDISQYKEELEKKISSSSFLVLGGAGSSGAGSIGQAVTKEIFSIEQSHL